MDLLTISFCFDSNMDLLFICRMDEKRNNFVWKITINKKQNEMIDDILQKSTSNLSLVKKLCCHFNYCMS